MLVYDIITVLNFAYNQIIVEILKFSKRKFLQILIVKILIIGRSEHLSLSIYYSNKNFLDFWDLSYFRRMPHVKPIILLLFRQFSEHRVPNIFHGDANYHEIYTRWCSRSRRRLSRTLRIEVLSSVSVEGHQDFHLSQVGELSPYL